MLGRCRHVYLLALQLIVIAPLRHVSCYNVDTLGPIIRQGLAGSAFGLQAVPFEDADDTMLVIVGAPRADSTHLGKGTGAVFRCPVKGIRDCTEISGLDDVTRVVDNRTANQLLGQAVVVSHDELPNSRAALVCAPLYREYKLETFLPLGRCFVLNTTLKNPEAVYPWDSLGYPFFDSTDDSQIVSMAGQSATINSYFGLGAPGAYNRRGTVTSTRTADLNAFQDIARGPHYTVRNYRSATPSLATPDQDTYLGYSLAYGQITKEVGRNRFDYVIGQPRGKDMFGEILIYEVEANGQLDEKRTIGGDQVGSYMGHTVCVVNLNGDDYDDMVIGAPYYATGGTRGSNEGRVYVYGVLTRRTQTEPKILSGTHQQGFFGMAIGAIGDINRDGLQDIAVGAPGELQHGRVYIYHGHKVDYIVTKSAQIIDGSAVSPGFTPTFFGYTVTGGVDVDKNEFPDVVVGSFASDRIWVLRSRPVIKVYGSLSFSPEEVNLDSQTCKSDLGGNVTCVEIRIVFSYESKNINIPPPNTAVIGYTVSLDFDHLSQLRLRFKDNQQPDYSGNVGLRANENVTETKLIYITPSIQDKENNFRVKLAFYEPEEYTVPPTMPPNEFPNLYPIIDNDTLESEHIATATLQVLRLCKGDDGDVMCNPNIIVTPSITYNNTGTDLTKVNFTVAGGRIFQGGERPVMILHIRITNPGEAAYRSQLVVTLPSFLQFQRANIIRSREDTTAVRCQRREGTFIGNVGESHVDCDIGNPLRHNAVENLDLYLVNSFVGDEGRQYITINATSNGVELNNNEDDNVKRVPFDVKGYALLIGVGTFFPTGSKVRYAVDKTVTHQPLSVADMGPSITHKYSIRNNGPSTIKNLHLSITWPLQNEYGKDIFYLYSLEIPGFDTNACDDTFIDRDSLLNSTNQRRKRKVYALERSYNADGCDSNICVYINCTLNVDILPKQLVTVILNASLVEHNFVNYTANPPKASSNLEARIVSDFFYKTMPYSQTVHSKLGPKGGDETYYDCVPFWVIIASVIGGVVILSIIILVLCFCGFFKTMGQSGSMTVNKTRDMQWKTASPTTQLPAGTVAQETFVEEQRQSMSHEKGKQSPGEKYELSEYDGSGGQSRKSMSADSDSIKKGTPANGGEAQSPSQSTV